MIGLMPINESLQAWRKFRQFSVSKLANESGLDIQTIEVVEAGDLDPSVSILESLAQGLRVPTSWLFHLPKALELLLGDSDEPTSTFPDLDSPDPVTERILCGVQYERELYVLLTSLLRHGEPKLLRAAEINLRSLLKQTRTATVPWQNRPSGHFEPPSD